MKENISVDELNAMNERFDKNRDGEINKDEILAILKKTSIY
jgi:Ca2+-binding EF-hand superfamily protein